MCLKCNLMLECIYRYAYLMIISLNFYNTDYFIILQLLYLQLMIINLRVRNVDAFSEPNVV